MTPDNNDNALIIDDDFISRRLIEQILKSQNISFISCENAEDAWEKYREFRPGLVITDWMLPGKDGIWLCRQIRQEFGQESVILVLTGKDQEEDLLTALESGADDFYTKSQNIQQLKVRIKILSRVLAVRRERRLIQEALLKSERHFRAIYDNAAVGVAVVDLKKQRQDANHALMAMLGYDSIDTDENHVFTCTYHEDYGRVSSLIRTFLAGKERQLVFDKRCITAKNELIWVRVTVSIMHDNNQSPDFLVEIVENITQKKLADEALKRSHEQLLISQQRYELAVQGANDGLWDWNLRSNELFLSSRWKKNLGYDEGDLSNTPNSWFKLVHPEDLPGLMHAINQHLYGKSAFLVFENRILNKSGHYQWVSVRGMALMHEHEQPHRMAGSQTDITSQKTIQKQMEYHALHDTLTGIGNREMFVRNLETALEHRSSEPGRKMIVAVLDLDRFKIINETLGHKAGDSLIRLISERLQACLAAGDIVARMAGDEFAVLFQSAAIAGEPEKVIHWIEETMTPPFVFAGENFKITFSAGLRMINGKHENSTEILRDAYAALNRAKETGFNQTQIYSELTVRLAMETVRLENELRKAIERNELVLYYQPQINIKTGRIVGVEALVRWNHPELGLIPPGRFIPLAEEAGIIQDLGNWVLVTACRDSAAWSEAGFFPLQVAVNFSSLQFNDEKFMERLEYVMRLYSTSQNKLEIELTESVVMHENERIRSIMNRFKELGVNLAIDDFGTGYSSLSYLKRFPVNSLKIDQSFIRHILSMPEDAAIVRAIIAMAHSLNLDVVAEGVESIDQWNFLKAEGCDIIQGYYFSHPLPYSQLVAFFTEKFHSSLQTA